MQQRLQIARCLAQDPAVLLMDEPFGALDAMTRQGLQDELLRLIQNRAHPPTALFVTHDLEEAIYLGDRVVALYPNPGRIAAGVPKSICRVRAISSPPASIPKFLRLRREIFDFIREAEA